MSYQTFTTTGTVTGLSCEHCVASVAEEVGALPGVCDVLVDLPTGRLTLTSSEHVELSELRRAVVDAGYQLVNPVG